MQARASIEAGDFVLVLPINPNSASWDYQENVVSRDTVGGRVVQLLSVQINNLSVDSVAGSRVALQRMASGIQEIMRYHIASSRPARFKVPSRKWDFMVYITAMPQIGWDVASTTYPYHLDMAIEEDISATTTNTLMAQQLDRLKQGIGYNPLVHGDTANGQGKAFADFIKSVLGATHGALVGGGSSGIISNMPTNPTTINSGGNYPGSAGGPYMPGAHPLPKVPAGTVQEKIRAVWPDSEVPTALFICQRESGFNPKPVCSPISRTVADGGCGNTNGSIDRGLFQINDSHVNTAYKAEDTERLFEPDFNIQIAKVMWQDAGWAPWS